MLPPWQPDPAEARVERRAWDALQNSGAELRAAYRRKFGSEIGADNAREIVSSEYAASREARTRWTRATQKPAAALADQLFEEALLNPDPDKARLVVMTAGGTGAGKTTAIRGDPHLAEVQFVYDSNLGARRSSVAKISAARVAGNGVRVMFVHRDPVEAFAGGVLPRAMMEGRVVDLEGHARTHRDSAENFAWLIRKFAVDPGVRFQALDNARGPGQACPMPLEEAVANRYSTNELRPKLRAALETEYAHGRISAAVYRASLGPPPERRP